MSLDSEGMESPPMATSAISNKGTAKPATERRLDLDERQALRRCENVVRKGAAAFVRVGLAFREIRDRRLYRETHSSFESYCVDRFGFKRAHGYRLVEEATAVIQLKQLSPIGDTILPLNEAQARELAKAAPAQRLEVMHLARELAGKSPLTANVIRLARVELETGESAGRKLIPDGGDDCVNTPDWLADEIVRHFLPSGRILEPCLGAGAFARAMPGCDTLDINKGQDFLTVAGHWDWIVTNPPYSNFRAFLKKGMEVADNVVFLALVNAWFVRARQDDIREAGFGLVEVYEVPPPKPPWPQFGMTLGAAWLRRGWTGGINYTRRVTEDREEQRIA